MNEPILKIEHTMGTYCFRVHYILLLFTQGQHCIVIIHQDYIALLFSPRLYYTIALLFSPGLYYTIALLFSPGLYYTIALLFSPGLYYTIALLFSPGVYCTIIFTRTILHYYFHQTILHYYFHQDYITLLHYYFHQDYIGWGVDSSEAVTVCIKVITDEWRKILVPPAGKTYPGVIGSDAPWQDSPATNAITWVITVTE